MANHEALLQENFIECLRLSDRGIVASFVVLFIGAITAKYQVVGEAQGVRLPVGDLTVAPTESALWILLALHFVNGLRYMFLLFRAQSIARRLAPEVLKAARSYPAAATSNVMTESFVSLILALLSGPITNRLFESFGVSVVVMLLASSPFFLGAALTNPVLNARGDA